MCIVVAQLLAVMFLLRSDVPARCICGAPEWRSLPWVLRGALEGLTLAVHGQAGGAPAGLPCIQEQEVRPGM